MATVCAMAVRSEASTCMVRVQLARRQERRTVRIMRAERTSRPALPGFLVLRIGLVAQARPVGGIVPRLVLCHRRNRLPQRSSKP
jgi:hypothetical protein